MSHPNENLRCYVCSAPSAVPCYESDSSLSVTSLCDVIPVRTVVYFCEACGHLQTPPLENLEHYYRTDYKILLGSEDEDQLVCLPDGTKVYRSAHQAETLTKSVGIREGAKLLDYGCAKGATMKRLKQMRPDIDVHLFDVSDMYLPYWEKLVPNDRWAIREPRPEWQSFDLITSFFAFEHLPDPKGSLAQVASLLAPDGIFYAVVPDWTQNVADVIVADHTNHFSRTSLEKLLLDAQLTPLVISSTLHQSALVVVAQRTPPPAVVLPDKESLADLSRRIRVAAEFWQGFRARVRDFEQSVATKRSPAAIYGAGFYGSYLATCLADLSRVACFLDQNPFQHGKELLGKPIVPPSELPAEVETVYVGLNPSHAVAEMARVECWKDRQLSFFYPG